MLATWLNRKGWADDYSGPPPRDGPLASKSILVQIATGELWNERNHNDIDDLAAYPAEPGGFRSDRDEPERAGTGGGGTVLDFRKTGTGWA